VIAATPEDFARVSAMLEQLDMHLREERPENKRKIDRVKFRTSLTAVVLHTSKPVPVEIFSRNISLAGMGFVSRRLFQRGERIAISLDVQRLPAKLILGRVMFGRYVCDGLYEMGAEFIESITVSDSQMRSPPQWLTRPRASANAAAR
jgi:hypothetical protein